MFPPENQLSLFRAITTLNEASQVFIETDFLHITPVSIRIKRALPEGLIQKFYWEALEEKLAEKMYHKSAVIKKCVDFYSSKLGSWDMVHLVAGVNGIHIPVNFEILAGRISNAAREKRAAEIAKEHACKSRRITRYDERCP